MANQPGQPPFDQRTAIKNRIAQLVTQAGAEAFLAERKAALKNAPHTLSSSMAWQCQKLLKRIETEPQKFVDEHIQQLSKRSAQTSLENKR